MSRTRIVSLLLLALCLPAAGCGDTKLLRTRYKAERIHWSAARAELTARLASEGPDSVRLLALRDAYRAVAEDVRLPVPTDDGENARRVRGELIRVMGTAELQAAKLGLEANRADLALEDCGRAAELAAEDSALSREADLFRVQALRASGRTEDAIVAMRGIVLRYRPAIPEQPTAEDPVLALPEAIVAMRQDMGDRQGAEQAILEAKAYYRGQLTRGWPPEGEAAIRARLVRLLLEEGEWDDALRELQRLQTLAQTTPALSDLEPEIRYFEASIRARKVAGRDPSAASKLFDAVVEQYPKSPFAARAAFDASRLLEEHGRDREALERYRWISSQFPQDDAAPAAAYRRALLEDKHGDWVAAKNLLEMIPLRYPESPAALDAPMAIVRHYREAGETLAARAALRKALATYQGLHARRSKSAYRAAYRWSEAKAQLEMGDWDDALKTIDEMAASDPTHPLTLQGLLQGAKVAEAHGQDQRAADYLGRYLALHSRSPQADAARADLSRLRKAR